MKSNPVKGGGSCHHLDRSLVTDISYNKYSVHLLTFYRRLRSKPGQAKKTTEDLELEKINKLREETKVNLKKNTSYLKKALAAVSYGPTRSATEITKPVEFHFATDSRIKPHPMVLRNQNAEKDFQDQLRKHPPSPVSEIHVSVDRLTGGGGGETLPVTERKVPPNSHCLQMVP